MLIPEEWLETNGMEIMTDETIDASTACDQEDVYLNEMTHAQVDVRENTTPSASCTLASLFAQVINLHRYCSIWGFSIKA